MYGPSLGVFSVGSCCNRRWSCLFFPEMEDMTIKVTILSAQPLIPPKRLYAQKVQACFDEY